MLHDNMKRRWNWYKIYILQIYLQKVVNTASTQWYASFFDCNILYGVKVSNNRLWSNETQRYPVDNERLIIHEGCFRMTSSLKGNSKGLDHVDSNPMSTCSAYCVSYKYFILQGPYCTCIDTLVNFVKKDLKNCGNGCGFPNKFLFVNVYRHINDLETFLHQLLNKCVFTAIFTSDLEMDEPDQYVTGHMVWLAREKADKIHDEINRLTNNSCIECKSDRLIAPVPCHQWTPILCFPDQLPYKNLVRNQFCQTDEWSTPMYEHVTDKNTSLITISEKESKAHDGLQTESINFTEEMMSPSSVKPLTVPVVHFNTNNTESTVIIISFNTGIIAISIILIAAVTSVFTCIQFKNRKDTNAVVPQEGRYNDLQISNYDQLQIPMTRTNTLPTEPQRAEMHYMEIV